MKRVLLSFGLAAAVIAANAESRSAFLDVNAISGITTTGGGLDWTVNVGATPTFDFGGTTYNILSVIGFWALSNDVDVIASGSGFAEGTTSWDFEINNAGDGGAAGWQTNYAGGANGIDPNGSQAFHFTTLDASTVDQWGYKVVVDGLFPGTTGNTGHITVPEPSTFAAFALGGLILAIKRRRR